MASGFATSGAILTGRRKWAKADCRRSFAERKTTIDIHLDRGGGLGYNPARLGGTRARGLVEGEVPLSGKGLDRSAGRQQRRVHVKPLSRWSALTVALVACVAGTGTFLACSGGSATAQSPGSVPATKVGVVNVG